MEKSFLDLRLLDKFLRGKLNSRQERKLKTKLKENTQFRKRAQLYALSIKYLKQKPPDECDKSEK